MIISFLPVGCAKVAILRFSSHWVDMGFFMDQSADALSMVEPPLR